MKKQTSENMVRNLGNRVETQRMWVLFTFQENSTSVLKEKKNDDVGISEGVG